MTYAVRLSEAGMLVSAGEHRFAEPVVEGAEVTWNGEQWIVEQVEEDRFLPVVTLRRP